MQCNINENRPAGRTFARQAMVRYTHPLGPGALDIALESPETTLRSSAGGVTRDDDRVPDVVLRYTADIDTPHFGLAVMGREIRADQLVAGEDSTGLSLSLLASFKATLPGKDDIKFIGVAGRGLGRYLTLGAFPAGTIDDAGDIELLDVFAGLLSYQRKWTDTVRNTIAISYAQAQNGDDSLLMTANKSLFSIHANALWNPIEPTRLGIELIYARREIESGESGDLSRVQGSVRYMF